MTNITLFNIHDKELLSSCLNIISDKVLQIIQKEQYETIYVLAGNYGLLSHNEQAFPLIPENYQDIKMQKLCRDLWEEYNFDTQLPYISMQFGAQLYDSLDDSLDKTFLLLTDDKKLPLQLRKDGNEKDNLAGSIRASYLVQEYDAVPEVFRQIGEKIFGSTDEFQKILSIFPSLLRNMGKNLANPYLLHESYLVKYFNREKKKKNNIAFKSFDSENQWKSSCVFELYSLFDLIKKTADGKKTCMIGNFSDICEWSFFSAGSAHVDEKFHTIAITPSITDSHIYTTSYNNDRGHELL